MNNNNDKHSAAVNKRSIIVPLFISFLLLAVVACTWFLKAEQDTQIQRQEYAEIFRDYAPFGLLYSEKENRLYYEDELVRYFEDIGLFGSLCGRVCEAIAGWTPKQGCRHFINANGPARGRSARGAS